MNPGIGTMLFELGGGSDHSASEYYGKKIKTAVFANDSMTLEFEDGVKIAITDQGQSCCEYRYMTCDNDLSTLVGKTLTKIEVKYSWIGGEYSDHEVAFLEIQTNDNVVTFATHNEHNGYYGGFGLNISEIN